MNFNDIRCVILAAGASTRLRPLTDATPKCLLLVNGKTLLERTIDHVLLAGVNTIAIVIGYKSEMIRECVKQQFPHRRIRFIVNPNYTSTNNAYSLLLARRFLENREGRVVHPLLLLDSDIYFSSQLFPAFLAHGITDRIAIRIQGEHDEEEIRVTVDSMNFIQSIGKNIPLEETYGESIGIELFSPESTAQLFKILQQRIRKCSGRKEFYESTFQEMIDAGAKIRAVDVSHFPVIEIDTAEDFARAKLMKIE